MDSSSPDLFRAASRGAPEALDAWFRSEHPGVYRLCLGFLADAGEAEDVAQEAMLHLLDQHGAYDASRPYPTWRDSVVLNRCRDRLRRNAARERAHAGAADRVSSTAESDPHAELEQREVQAILMESLSALSPREREVFVLRDLEERSTTESAATLGVGQSTVRSLLTLARRRLRGVLEQRLPGISGEESHG